MNINKDEKNLNYVIFLVNHYIKKKYENTIEDVKEYKYLRISIKFITIPLSNENIISSIPISTQYMDKNIYNVDKDIIIQSWTDMSKSYSIRLYLSNLQKTKPEIKILNLSRLISLCDASISSFNTENIELMKYNAKYIYDFDDKI